MPATTIHTKSALNQLRSRLSKSSTKSQKYIATSINPLKSLLPEEGFRAGTIVEWSADCNGSHTVVTALSSVKSMMAQNSPMVVLDAQHCLYPPAFSSLGISLDSVLIIRPNSPMDAIWTLEQSLRCKGLSAVCTLGLEIPQQQSSILFRRFRLAAEYGQTLGLFVNHGDSTNHSKWADLRFHVEPLATQGSTGHRRIRVRLKGSRSHGRMTPSHHPRDIVLVFDELTGQITHETNRLSVVPELATSAVLPMQARA